MSTMSVRKRSHSVDFFDGDDTDLDLASIVQSKNIPFTTVTRRGKKKKKIGNSQPEPSLPVTPTITDNIAIVHDVNDVGVGQCVFCDVKCHVSSSIQCVECLNYFHLDCHGISINFFPTATVICKLLSWSCDGCRIATNDELKKLRLDLANLHKKVNSLQQPVQTVTSGAPVLGAAASTTGSTTGVPVSINTASRPSTAVPLGTSESRVTITSVVLQTLSVLGKKKKNVIFTGLNENPNGSDLMAANDLITNHVKCPRPPPIASCLRLGKSITNGKPRKLLARFNSEADAQHLLLYAKTLRISSDTYIARNIFINPDLTKEEAKLAYEKRILRKRGPQQGVVITTNTNDPTSSIKLTPHVLTSSSTTTSSNPTPSVHSSTTLIAVQQAPTTVPVSSLRPTAAGFDPASSTQYIIPVVVSPAANLSCKLTSNAKLVSAS